MNSQEYLEQYGWKQGEALKKGGIKKPILVKHKKDKKGIGHVVNGSADAWWERLFDGQLKSLDVSSDTGNGISFKQDKVVATAVRTADSPLYRMFVRGETLQGTTGKVKLIKSTINSDGSTSVIDTMKTSFNDPTSKNGENVSDEHKKRSDKKDKKSSSSQNTSKKEKKEKKGSKSHKNEKREKKSKDEDSKKKDRKSKSKSSFKEESPESDISSTEDKTKSAEKKKIKKSKKDKLVQDSKENGSKSSKKDSKSKKRKSSDIEDSTPKSKKVKAL